MSAKIISVVSQKGGVTKSTTCINLGVGLARHGKRVLLVDNDPQGSMTISLGFQHPDKIAIKTNDMLSKIILKLASAFCARSWLRRWRTGASETAG